MAIRLHDFGDRKLVTEYQGCPQVTLKGAPCGAMGVDGPWLVDASHQGDECKYRWHGGSMWGCEVGGGALRVGAKT